MQAAGALRVLLISHTCQSRAEGQPRALELAKFDGIELCVLAPQRFNHYGVWREAEAPEGNEYSFHARRIVLPWLGPAQNYLHWYPSLPRLLRQFSPDVIDLWEETWSLCTAHACWLRNRILPDARIVAETEQNIAKKLPPPFEHMRRYVLKNADFCIGRSDEAISVLRAKGYGGPAASVPNAVDAALFRPLDRAHCRHLLGLPADDFLAGYVGRLVKEKGVFDLLEALVLLSPATRVLFLGDGPARAGLEARAEELGLANRVIFLAQRPQHELPVAMNALDVLVLPSRTTASWKEQFGRVLIEAMACGVPVIGSNSGAIPDVVSEAGLVVPEGDQQALAAALIVLHADPLRRRALGEFGRRQVEEKYTWARVASHLNTIYREVCADI
jgi:glycosyltransferase involved in cell wall biosynthesis